jgi:exopolyphosphatase/guanosine-5'-triphosphate,3'-diphosphate pyrophosphatase
MNPAGALSMNVNGIAALIQGIRQYDKSRIHGFTIRMKDLEGLISALAPLKSAARKDIPGMEAGREDIIVQGALILKEVMMHGNFDSCIVSAAGVRYGLLYERC